MKCLITGCSGVIGLHLAEHLVRHGAEVWGTYHSSQLCNLSPDGIRWLKCNIVNGSDVDRAIDASQPDHVFHLAAQSYPVKSWSNPDGTFQVNVTGTLNVLDAVRKRNLACQFVIIGSSAEYGSSSAQAEHISETAELAPDSPYGVSKVAADLMADVYFRAYRMNIIRVRPFLVIGPGPGSNVFIQFAKRIVEVERGEADSLAVGNLSIIRDVVDVRDAARAILMIAERGTPGSVYNICTGQSHSIRDGLEIMLKLGAKPVRVYSEPAVMRPLDTPRLVGDSSRLRQLGWTPTIPLGQTLADILEFWRVQARHSMASSRA